MPRYAAPGVGAPTRARSLGKQANLQEEREAGVADPCRGRGAGSPALRPSGAPGEEGGREPSP